MEKLVEYYTVDENGQSTKTHTETVTVDLDAEIQSKEDQLLAVYAEIEALKAQKAAE